MTVRERVLPAPDLYAVCPLRGPILPFYEGVFEAAYIILNPFMRPRPSSVGPSVEMMADLSADKLCRAYEPVSWAQILELSGLPSLASIDVALRTAIGGLNAQHANKENAALLDVSLKRHGLLPPCEGLFPELMQDPMLSFMQSLDQDWAWVGDDVGTERKLHWIDDLKPASAKHHLVRASVFTPDKTSLWTVHWDSHFSLFCSTQENIARLAEHPGLEGFACDTSTEIYWGVPAA
ncbi:DUF2711 domain-containing protein [Ideonella azotifigens]|uniref:DUF2711 family protein n=1 Tax=Ideonella azotifigens TaxID=513160 RepID=A0ABN1KKS8_9BURK|nr:DUF2711 family protein [Ideonella azotifigens]MCD2339165.1 DUF2711 domain-containing protein [Ideonella azotifigens]